MNTLDAICSWHNSARPDADETDFNVQLGCHIEEIVEMLQTVNITRTEEEVFSTIPVIDAEEAINCLSYLATNLKDGSMKAQITNRNEFLDSLADQIVTAVGIGHCAKMNVPLACERVNESNWSKFDEEGYPIFDENGKIMKGPDYKKPNLDGLY